MKDRPILFSGEMVRAILDGKKTQTRRIIKWPKDWVGFECDHIFPLKNKGYSFWSKDSSSFDMNCPYGVVGDRLWVKEAWQAGIEWDTEKPSEIDPLCGGSDINYLANGVKLEEEDGWGKVRSPIFMPKWATRIWLEITGTKVERVQEIDENGACAEGCELYTPETNLGAERTFQRLWDSLNAKRGYSWEKNPWVWVVEFKKVEEKS